MNGAKTLVKGVAPLAPPTVPVHAVQTRWARSLLTFLMVMGPGIIVMVADNDAGAVSTYVQAGAQYGAHLFWLLLLLLPTTYFIQEMVARLGIATGQGHAAMIFRRFGRKWGLFSLTDLLLLNFLTLVTEFAAVSLAFRQMGVPPDIAVVIAASGLILLVTTGSYLRWERATLFLCALDLVWFALAVLTRTPAAQIARDVVVPNIPPGGITSNLVFLVIAIVGTTIAPWQLFFQQSCVADKKLRFADLKFARLDTFVGAVGVILVAGCMMLVGAIAYRRHMPFTDPASFAQALLPSMGPFVRNSILLLMVNAAILGATTISLSSSWAYGEVRGWKHSLELGIKDAPGFYAVYIACVVAAAAIVLIPRAPLQLIIVSVQVLAGLMLPSAIIFLQLLLNDRELLGEQFVNKAWNNWVNWSIIILLFALSLVLAVQVLLPGLLPGGTS